MQRTIYPPQKPKKKDLTSVQKEENKLLASKRIVVEPALAGLKRYRIL
jgi:DDE superfamily endonuclease